MKRLIIFLVRKKLGLRLFEEFRFTNQKSKTDWYFFDKRYLWKVDTHVDAVYESHVSLNYILSDKCHIVKIGEKK